MVGTSAGSRGDLGRCGTGDSARRPPAATVLDEAQGPLIVTEVVRDAVIEAVTAGQPPGLSDLLAEYSVGDVQSWTARLLAESDRLEAMIRNRDALGARERTIIDLTTTARDLLNRRLEEMAAVDFDRIIVWTRDLLRDGPVRAVLQRRIHTLIV